MDGELLLIINQSQQTFQVASRDCKDPLGGAPGLGVGWQTGITWDISQHITFTLQ